MSVQLIVFPQYFDGSTPLSSPSTQFFVDGINFNQVNASSSTLNIAGALPQTFINSNTLAGYTFFISNTWYRFSSNANYVEEGSNVISVALNTGILQRLSNLTFGATYDLTLSVQTNTTTFTVYQYHNNILKSSHIITGTGTQTIQFDAYSTADTIVIYSTAANVIIEDISCVLSTSTPSGVFTDLSNGQVICDLYEDEDIPLSLSVDDFKNVAEKVQSYSKAFNLPATKRNNQIFDNIFEVTRTDTGLNFNPYKKTKCILKQDGFLLFEGYLRMIDISDKSGEISYNVNLYSEVVALADVLGEKTFSDLDFTELDHDYNVTQVQYSWDDAGTGMTFNNPSTSGFRNAYTTLRYPFVDWTGKVQDLVTEIYPPNLESVFRPYINIKYLIDRIFNQPNFPFRYTSEFFNTDDFNKLYMDFNWGADNSPVEVASTSFQSTYIYNLGDGSAVNYATSSFTVMNLSYNIAGLNFDTPPNYNDSTNIITSTVANETYNVNYTYIIQNIDSVDREIECQWLYNSTPIDYTGIQTIADGGTFTYSGNFTQVMTNVGDTLQVQFRTNTGTANQVRQSLQGAQQNGGAYVQWTVAVQAVTTNTMLQTLRGELGQMDFLKGIMTMFNLVSIPDEEEPNNILIEPYADVFINNPNSVELDWTDKIDVSAIKLVPLTDLNKKTMFKFVEDEDDYAFNVYKKSVGGHLYGSKKYDASEYTILAGEEEILAEPFAATVVKPLFPQYTDLITPALYSMSDDGTAESFENSPRIMYNNGIKATGIQCFIQAQNGSAAVYLNNFLQFSHLSSVPTISGARDFHFGECQLIQPTGAPANDNLFNLYWLPYYSELYNPDTRIMTLKVNLSPSDINTFRFFDTVIIKNRTYRVNKIDYKPNDLATVEFILLP